MVAYIHTQKNLGLVFIPTPKTHTQNPKILGMEPKPKPMKPKKFGYETKPLGFCLDIISKIIGFWVSYPTFLGFGCLYETQTQIYLGVNVCMVVP